MKSSPQLAAEFKGLTFNSPEFQKKWKQLAKDDPSFAQAQQQFAEQTFYAPVATRAAAKGLILDNISPAAKEVLFSTGIQHGAGTDVIDRAIDSLPGTATEQDLIKAIYKERWRGGLGFASSTEQVKTSVYNRFFGKDGEMNRALALSKQYTG